MSQAQSAIKAISNILDRDYGDTLEQLHTAEIFRSTAIKYYNTAMNRLKKDKTFEYALKRLQQVSDIVYQTREGKRGVPVAESDNFTLICDVKAPSLKVDRELVRQTLLELGYRTPSGGWKKIGPADAERILADQMCSYTNPAKEFHVFSKKDSVYARDVTVDDGENLKVTRLRK